MFKYDYTFTDELNIEFRKGQSTYKQTRLSTQSVLCERFNYKALQGKYTQVNSSTLEALQN